MYHGDLTCCHPSVLFFLHWSWQVVTRLGRREKQILVILPDPVVPKVMVIFMALTIHSSVDFDAVSLEEVVYAVCGEVVVCGMWEGRGEEGRGG